VRRLDGATRPHSRDLRLNRLSDSPETFFITKSLRPKKPVLDARAREIIVSALEFAVREKRIHLRAFVVMPDHWHAVFALREPWTLPRFMHALMSFVAAKTSAVLRLHGTWWQDGYYDTRVKTPKQLAFVVNYIEQNPIARRLVEHPEEWEASSANRRDLIAEPWPWLVDGAAANPSRH
jgi:REP element-mobilizing transposase RayT